MPQAKADFWKRCCSPRAASLPGVTAEGAEQQFPGRGLSREQKVDGPELDGLSLARPGARYARQRAVYVADDLPLPGIQLRVQAQNYGCLRPISLAELLEHLRRIVLRCHRVPARG